MHTADYPWDLLSLYHSALRAARLWRMGSGDVEEATLGKPDQVLMDGLGANRHSGTLLAVT